MIDLKVEMIGLIAAILFILIVEILGIILISGQLALYFGFTGIYWWIVSITLFITLNTIIYKII